MPTLAYGLFTTPADAEHARTIIFSQITHPRPLRVIEHAHEVHDQLLPKLGPRVRRDSWIGILLATVMGALLGGVVLGGVLGDSPIIAALLTGMAALTIGLMFTGISRSARARRLIDRLRREVLAGRVLITAEADTEAAAR
ncbi:MAG: hypothetical protein HC927_10980, partial [Deltaproteobacteria bacterium]|nr:hypothetical protein [Deltaproteobacteria bacterium]